jgi:hypothetical protein
MQAPKAQLNVRINHVCVELLKLERKSLPGCTSDGEAVESLILRASTSPEARQIIKQAVAQDPLFSAAQRAWELDQVNSPNHQPTEAEIAPQPGDAPGDLARRYAAGSAKTPTTPPDAAPAANQRHLKPKKNQTQ